MAFIDYLTDPRLGTVEWRVCTVCCKRYWPYFPRMPAKYQMQELDGMTICPADRRKRGWAPALPPPDAYNPALNYDENDKPIGVRSLFAHAMWARLLELPDNDT